MNRFLIYSLAVLCGFASALTSCSSIKNANNTQKGAGIGVAAGALLGGIVGHYAGKGGNAALGAVVGAAVGLASGCLAAPPFTGAWAIGDCLLTVCGIV